MSDITTFELPGLSRMDRHELTEELGGEVRFEEEPLAADRAGEPVTAVAIVALSAMALRGISMWLLKRRSEQVVEQEIRIRHPDGREEVRRIVLRFKSSDPPPADVIEQVGAQLGQPAEIVAQALEG